MFVKYLKDINGKVLRVVYDQKSLDAIAKAPQEFQPAFLSDSHPDVLTFLAALPSDLDALLVSAKAKRQFMINETDPLAIRHMRQELRFTAPEMEALAKKGKALTLAQYKELEAYTQALRDLPTTLKTWPKVADSDWPKKPAFMEKSSTTGV
jgi:hypothetical protein